MDYAVVMNDLKTSVALHDESFSFSKSLCTLFLWRFSLLPIFALMRAPSIFMFPQTPSVQFSRSVMSDSLRPHESQHARPPCPSPTPRVYSNSCDWVSDAIQPSHPLLSPSPLAFNLSQHQGLFKWDSSSHQVAKISDFQLQHQSFQWTPRSDLL